jgi:glycosyltransferase involved in cell wall biosynthesis
MSASALIDGEGQQRGIMLVLSSSDLGGGEETVRLLAKHLDRTRFEVSVVCPPGPIFQRMARVPDVRLHELSFPRVPSVRTVRRLAELIRLERVEILHTHLYHGDLYGFLASRLVPVPRLVSTIQAINFFWEVEAGTRRARWRAASLVYRGIYRAFDGLATCSAAVREAVCTRRGLKIHRDRVTVIHNSMDLEELKPNTERKRATGSCSGVAGESRPKRLIAVANFGRYKGHRILLQAMAKLPTDPAVECWLVGDGPEKARMERLARDLGLMNRVRFLGYRQDVSALLHQCDLFVLPSLWEPFGIALVEAMVSGVPVLACRAGGVPEIVTDGETGLLVPPGDADALAAGLRRLLLDDALRGRLAAKAAPEATARFDARSMAERYQKWYDAI